MLLCHVPAEDGGKGGATLHCPYSSQKLMERCGCGGCGWGGTGAEDGAAGGGIG